MFSIKKPVRSEIHKYLETNRSSNFSYRDVGRTKDILVQREDAADLNAYNVDHNRTVIGKGDEDWETTKKAVANWKMFDMPWVQLCWPDTAIAEGQTVAVLIRHFGFYSLNSAQIVYVIDESNRFGFAYGTLADHGESGEERFLVEMDANTREIWYDLYAFSKPNHFLSMLGYPLTRILQKRFARDSKAAMIRATNDVA